MAELKTRKTGASVAAFLAALDDPETRKDCQTLVKMMTAATEAKPAMWGAAIVGFGDYRYKYASGREGDWFHVGFSPRKSQLTVYLHGGLQRQGALLKKIGKHKAGMGCLYVKRLSDLDAGILKTLIEESVRHPTGATEA